MHSFRRKLWTSTNLGLEPYLPASKGCWRGELVKMKIWDLQSLLICTIILWRVFSTEDDRNFGWRSRLASLILNLCLSLTLHRLWWVNLFWFLRTPWIQFLRIRCWRGRRWICTNVFPIFHVCPKCLAAHLCGWAFLLNGLAFHQELDEMGMTLVYWYCVLIQHLENLLNHSCN